MLFAETPDNLGTILTAVGGAVAAVLTGLVSGYVMLRKGRADARKQEVDVNTEEARAQLDLDHQRETWAVKEARDACRDLKKQMAELKLEMSGLVKSERDCQIRLATYITRDRGKTARVRELEKRLGIEPEEEDDAGLDQWADKTLTDEFKRVLTERDDDAQEHPRPGD